VMACWATAANSFDRPAHAAPINRHWSAFHHALTCCGLLAVAGQRGWPVCKTTAADGRGAQVGSRSRQAPCSSLLLAAHTAHDAPFTLRPTAAASAARRLLLPQRESCCCPSIMVSRLCVAVCAAATGTALTPVPLSTVLHSVDWSSR
jgi:hypothetical protein